MEGVHHPHSLLGRGKTTWVCESVVNRLISSDGDAYDFPSTYLRGLAMDGDRVYAGSSKRREFSESTGKRNERVDVRRRGRCCVYELRRSPGKLRVVADFSRSHAEIYDLMLLH